jgi:phospholipid-binding lipoprotein MlaA
MQTQTKSLFLIVLCALMLSGCASTGNNDPLEGMNRGVYKFNDVADKAVIKPIAGAYKAVLPTPVRSGVSNFFGNLNTFVSVINDLLQFKFGKAVEGAGRFVINSTFGIAGLVDVASMDGIEKRNEDFGQTLGHWGVGSGAYIVLPFLGPSSLRDTGGLVVDTLAFDPLSYVDEPATRNSARALKLLDKRAQLLPGSDLLDEAALDPYAFMRDAYFQRRENQIHDGNIPDLEEDAYN